MGNWTCGGGLLDWSSIVLGGQHNVGAHFAVGAEPFDEAFEVRKGARTSFEHRAVFAGQLVDLGHLRVVLRGGGPEQAVGELAAQLNEGQQWLTGAGGVYMGGVAGDDAGCSRRRTRSATAGEDRWTRRASSLKDSRPSACSSASSCQSRSSGFIGRKVISAYLLVIGKPRQVALCHRRFSAGTRLRTVEACYESELKGQRRGRCSPTRGPPRARSGGLCQRRHRTSSATTPGTAPPHEATGDRASVHARQRRRRYRREFRYRRGDRPPSPGPRRGADNHRPRPGPAGHRGQEARRGADDATRRLRRDRVGTFLLRTRCGRPHRVDGRRLHGRRNRRTRP
jgi:hypothetical protein